MHLHGGPCTAKQGGITQTFATTSGVRYKLEFLAYAGTWDGVDTDVVEVLVPYFTFSKLATTTTPKKVKSTFFQFFSSKNCIKLFSFF